MITPDDAFRDLLLSLNQLKALGRMQPDSFACTLAPHPDLDPWQVSLVIQPQPLGLRIGGILPLHLDPAETDVEAMLRRCNDINRQPFPFTFSLDPLGLVLSFRIWLPLHPSSGNITHLTGLALNLAEQAAQIGTSRFQCGDPVHLTTGMQQANPVLDTLREDEIPF